MLQKASKALTQGILKGSDSAHHHQITHFATVGKAEILISREEDDG